MVQSDHFPTIERLQDCIIVPYQVCETTIDNHTSWQYQEYRIPDTGQQFGEDEYKAVLLNLLNQEVGNFICSRYDSGTQSSFLALSLESDQVKTAIQPVWGWIKVVMAYYYEIKTKISNSGSKELGIITWDFEQFDKTDPGIQLGNLMSAVTKQLVSR